MGWVASANSEWINTQKSCGSDFLRSQDFSADSTTGNRYVAIYETTVTEVAEKRGLTEAAALAMVTAADATHTPTDLTFNDTKTGSPYSITLPGVAGTTVKLEANRENEANGWTVRRTTTTKSARAVWGDGSYSDTIASSVGTQKSASVRYYCQNVVAKWEPAVYVNGQPTSWRAFIVNINTVETTEEWTGLTESAAKSKAAAFGAHVTTQIENDGSTWESHSDSAEARYAGSQGWTVLRVVKNSTPVVNPSPSS